MDSLSVNMKFWHDGQKDSTRLRNVEFCWSNLKKLGSYLKNNNINIITNLYDFSERQVMNDAIHIPYPLGTYKKSEKTNLILKEQSDYQFFMMMDSDAFFDESDYALLLGLIQSLQTGDVITFDLAKLNNNIHDYIINNFFNKSNADWSYAYAGDRSNGPLQSHTGGLGGVYICDTNLLLSLGGFDEKYTGWGGEDGDMLSRISTAAIKHNIRPTRHFAPYHLPHFSDWGNPFYSQRFSEYNKTCI